MTHKTNPEAVILGALFDFAGHLRTADIINPHAGIDGFAKLRKLSATEVPTMTWRDQLDTLRDNAERLPSDSELVTDLLLLAEAFKDGDPDADNKVFDVLNNAATRLRRLDVQAERPTTYCSNRERRGHGESQGCGEKDYDGKPFQCAVCAGKDLKHAHAVIEALQAELKDGAQ
jgi:hypothetical protein